jgi:AcrR family transcriptional regulator
MPKSIPPTARKTPAKARKPAASRNRAPGRPSGDSADQRERLLDAAIACFVRHGIASTSLRAIATEAGVTPALLHYYYGDKAQLQAAVVGERLMPVFAALREALVRSEEDIAGLVAAFVRVTGELMARHPWLPSLWVREVLCEGGALRELVTRQLAPQIPGMLAQRFATAQREGRLNPGLDPRLLVVSLVGLTLFPAAGAPVWRQIFDADDIGPDAMRDHTVALLDRGLGVG